MYMHVYRFSRQKRLVLKLFHSLFEPNFFCTMSHNDARGRVSRVDAESGVVAGVHVEVERAIWQLTVD